MARSILRRLALAPLAGLVLESALVAQLAAPWYPVYTDADPGSIVWDARLQRVMTVGPLWGNYSIERLWEWNGTDPLERALDQPSSLFGIDALHFDPVAGILIAIDAPYAAVGTWNGGAWQWRSSPGIANIQAAASAFDVHRRRIVAWQDDGSLLEWDGYQWWQIANTAGPSPRTGAAVTYDAGRQRTVLFGGEANGLPRDDTWTYDGSAWTPLAGATTPGPRVRAALAFDPLANRVLLYGGSANATTTWQLQGSTWSPVSTAHDPGPRIGAHMTFDGGGMLLVGGRPGHPAIAYRFTGVDWVEVGSLGTPKRTMPFAIGTDAVRNQIVCFGDGKGGVANDETVLFDIRWRATRPNTRPPARAGAELAWSRANQGVLLHGGLDAQGQVLNDTWLWDGVDWLPQSPTTVPAARDDFALAPDPSGGVMRFGGRVSSSSAFTNDQYLWNGADWQLLNPTPRPPMGPYHRAALDVARNRLVMLPGARQLLLNNTTVWEWDGTAWGMFTTPPVYLAQSTITYDPQVGAVVAPGLLNANQWTGTSWLPYPMGLVTGIVTAHPRRSVLLAFRQNGSRLDSLAILTPTPPALAAVGSGCALGPAPRLGAVAMPHLGQTDFAVDVATLVASAPTLLHFGFAAQALPLGAGCTLRVAQPVATSIGVATSGGQLRVALPIPNVVALAGVGFYAQAAVYDPARSPIGTITVTGAVQVTFGR